MAKATKVAAAVEGEWSSEAAFYEVKVDEKRTVKACIATSPDGTRFVSVREWRNKADGTPYYTRNSVLVPIADLKMASAFVGSLQPANWPQQPDEEPVAKSAKKAPKEFDAAKAQAVAKKAKKAA